MAPRAALPLVALALALALPASAGAALHCVNKPSCVAAGGTAHLTVQSALDSSATNPGHDRVEIGPGDFTAPGTGFSYSQSPASNSIDIAGSGVDGPDRTRLLPPPGSGASTRTLFVGTSGQSVVQDLAAVARPPSGVGDFNQALWLDGATARRVLATGPSGATGVVLANGGALLDSRVRMEGSTTAAVSTGGSTNRVERSTLEHDQRAIAAGSGATIVRRTRTVAYRSSAVSGGPAIEATGSLLLENSLVEGAPDVTFWSGLSASNNGLLVARHVTVDARGAARGAQASAPSAATFAQVVLESSVIAGATNSLSRSASGGASANLSVHHSNYDPSTKVESGAGSFSEGAGNVNVAPGFVDPAARDYRLRADSAMLDLADPAPVDGPPSPDFAGGPRVAEGNGDGNALPDIGAFEFVSAPPTAVIAGPDTAERGVATGFSAGQSSDPDPGDSLRYDWGAGATGVDLTQAFPDTGTATIALTVTDRSGRTAVATKAVAVRDTVRPVLSKLSAAKKSFKMRSKGTKLRYTLSEPAAVSVQIQRRSGRKYRKVGTLTQNGRLGTNSLTFKGRFGATFLPPGVYRAAFSAKDPSGNSAKVRNVAFTVTR